MLISKIQKTNSTMGNKPSTVKLKSTLYMGEVVHIVIPTLGRVR